MKKLQFFAQLKLFTKTIFVDIKVFYKNQVHVQ